MAIEFGGDIDPMGSRQNGQDMAGGSRRNQHQQKLLALIEALKAGDLQESRAAYEALLAFHPGLAESYFQRVGHALASGNLSGAQRVIVEIYGQHQKIFTMPTAHLPAMPPRHSTRDDFGVLVDVSA